MIAQTAHGIAEYARKHGPRFDDWHQTSNTLVCLQANDENHLKHIAATLDETGHPVATFTEPDLEDSMTAVVFVAHRELRKKFSSLPLAGKVQK